MSTNHRSLFAELAETIGQERGGAHADRIARTICRHANHGIKLIGLGPAARNAVFFDPGYRRIYAVPVSPIGVHAAAVTVIRQRIDDPRQWLGDELVDLVWVHPEFQSASGDPRSDGPTKLKLLRYITLDYMYRYRECNRTSKVDNPKVGGRE